MKVEFACRKNSAVTFADYYGGDDVAEDDDDDDEMEVVLMAVYRFGS